MSKIPYVGFLIFASLGVWSLLDVIVYTNWLAVPYVSREYEELLLFSWIDTIAFLSIAALFLYWGIAERRDAKGKGGFEASVIQEFPASQSIETGSWTNIGQLVYSQLTSVPMDLREIATKMGITHRQDVVALQQSLESLLKDGKILMKITRGRKLYQIQN